MSLSLSRFVLALGLCAGLALPAVAADKPGKKNATLKLQIKPADVQIYVDEKPVGNASKERTLVLPRGRHHVKLVRKHVSHEEELSLKAGDSKVWAFQFGGGDSTGEVKLETPGEDASSGGEGRASEPAPVE